LKFTVLALPVFQFSAPTAFHLVRLYVFLLDINLLDIIKSQKSINEQFMWHLM